jgi:hypothetical protein
MKLEATRETPQLLANYADAEQAIVHRLGDKFAALVRRFEVWVGPF